MPIRGRGIKMFYSVEFERFWKVYGRSASEQVKQMCWEAWKAGREKLHEEMINTQLFAVRA